MRVRNLLMFLAAGCSLCQAEPSVRVALAGVRCLFPSPHDASRHRLVLRVDVLPETPEWSVREMSRALCIKGRDSSGAVLVSESGGWESTPQRPGARSAYFSFLLRGKKIAWLDVDETLQVQLAEQQRPLMLGRVSMLEAADYAAGGVVFRCEPDAGNAAEENREKDGTLRRAGLTLVYPEGVNILRVCRVWKGGRHEETNAELPPFTLELDVAPATVADGAKRSHVELWDVAPYEELEVTTCASIKEVEAPLRCRVMLGDPAPPPESASSAPESS
ncbi:MAG: hypothetical protein J1E42_03995 [Akkermansiaceae bacterium]|nr:hypothetical protein [Akkermansiaceae bacterium]